VELFSLICIKSLEFGEHRQSVVMCLHARRESHRIDVNPNSTMSAERFGEYEVLKREDGSLFELGRGAMGVTYKAFDTDLHRFVALKMINPAAMAHPEAEERFIREARCAAQLRHPNIAGIFRRDKSSDGTHYYAMEFCEGRTIDHLVNSEGPLDWRRALEISAQAAKALAAAARRNLIHRDIKPANLMLIREAEDEGEILKVIDFGLAKKTADDGAAWSSMGTQGFVGTAHFASPEQIQNGIVDARSDIYSLGATLWFMLRGSPPFTGSIWEIISKHVTATPDFSLLTATPKTVVELVRAMMEKNPADRPQTARELLDKIEKSLHPERESEPGSDVRPALEPTPAAWTPSLRDLLRIRRELEPVEAWCLGDKVADILDEEDQAGTSGSVLLIQGISVHFRDPLSESNARAKLHEAVTEWPPFELSIKASTDPTEGETVISRGMKTIITAGDAAGDSVQQLAHLLYELLGRVATSQCAPLASLDEKGNEVLRQGILKGTAVFSSAMELMDGLRATTTEKAVVTPAAEETDNGLHEVECPHCGEVEVVNAGTGTYECPGCGGDIEIILACPHCEQGLEMEEWGETDCPECGESFDSWQAAVVGPAGGGIDAGKHEAECPHCEEIQVVNDGTGTYECPDCGGDIDIGLACPRCGQELELEQWGKTDCPGCGASFDSWKKAVVTLAEEEADEGLHEVECPNCNQIQVVKDGTGTYECPDCGGDIDISLACPRCGQELEMEQWGKTDCPGCGASFDSWKEAEVT
jgi:serine/threonine protein kinase/Zn finger protein HypA/HybF involved in hydrogenase expression